jgi:hypothetical protein
MGNRKGMIFEAIERLDGLMAIGDKRSEAKAEAQARGEAFFAFSDHKIRSYETRTGYQAVVMRFLHWCRAHYGLNRLAQVDTRADELASAYLIERMEEEKSIRQRYLMRLHATSSRVIRPRRMTLLGWRT